jgi:protease I
MNSQMSGQNVMFLVANGFVEKDLLSLQRAIITNGATSKLVSCEKNLVNGFNDGEWGLTFPVEQSIDTALAADFDAVVIVGGKQSVDRLSKNAHTQRIIEAFVETEKPIVVLNEAVELVEGHQTPENIVRLDGEVDDDMTVSVMNAIVTVDDLAHAA